MKSIKTIQINMNTKTITKEYRRLFSAPFRLSNLANREGIGLIYTLYSDNFNLLKIGFAKNNKELETTLLEKDFILLDKKKGSRGQLNLIIKALNELNIKFSGDFNFKYTNILVRHLTTLGWPLGRSLYKQRKIKKELSCA